jgi:hypothetical protein
MLLLTEPTLFYWNLLNDFPSDLKQAYTGTISKWAQRVQKTNAKNTHAPAAPRSNASSHRSTNTALSRLTKVTTATSVTAPPVTPTSSIAGDEPEIVACLFDEDDQPERMAAHALVGMRRQPGLRNASGLRNVVAQVAYYFISPRLPTT